MSSIKTILLAVIFLIPVSAFSADVTKDEMRDALTKKLSHPYLFFTEEEKQSI